MKELGFVCAWGKDREKSWSGTHYGLYTHLKKYYDLTDIDIGENRNSFCSLKGKITKRIKRLIKLDDMNLSAMRKGERIVKNKTKNKNIPLIQFGECPFEYHDRHYIYQDLHVGYVKKLIEEQPDIFKISGYQQLTYNAIRKREKYQKAFYKNADGIFTMGKWLAKELVDEYEIPSEKVFHVGGGVNIDISQIDYTQKKGNKILFVGRAFERKNGPLVIEAFNLARKIRTDLELYIAGPKDLKFSGGGNTPWGCAVYGAGALL